ncbi:MAG: Mannose-1-phosphate guanylyltransferase [Parcubacteria group bacterium GW2011_GWA1_38_7]|nr:MAG: Mannose-1-phosphate guanylyltransferase [Parcubacteria group bacterium GW2011_GWA1_38_7]
MCGGGGTRLWPKSLDRSPKQFLRLFNKKTLVEITGERLAKLLPWEKIFVVTTTKPYGDEIRKLLPKVPTENIIVEPEKKETAAAHALGAAFIMSKDPQAVIINAASDHFVTPQLNYENTMLAASKFSFENDCLIAVGIRPTYPHTGMGHLKKGDKVANSEGRYVFKLDKFVEKPPLDLATKYTESGDYFWNANHYVWRADTFLNEVDKYAKTLSKGINIIRDNIGKKNEKEVVEKEYKKLEKISVDYAISEKSDNFYMIIADYSWTDIGDWNELWKNLPKDGNGNVIISGDEEGGEVINIDTTDALIHTDGRLIAVIDVDNLVIVDTEEALLICSKSHSQSVKKIVEKLRKDNRKDLL